jgi:hypothetical protein
LIDARPIGTDRDHLTLGVVGTVGEVADRLIPDPRA